MDGEGDGDGQGDGSGLGSRLFRDPYRFILSL